MKKLCYILLLFLFVFPTALFGQKKNKNKQLTEKAKEDVAVLSSMDFPYIEKFHQGIREKLSGNYKEAKKLFNECLEIRQDDDGVYFALAEIAKKEQNPNKALEYFQRARELDKENIVYLEELAFIHFEKASFDEAEVLFNEMCELQPRNVDFRYGYIRVLIYNKSYKNAIVQIDKLLEQVGIVPELMGMKADLYLEQNKTDEAENTMLQLKKEYPDDVEVLRNVIGFYEQIQNYDKAIKLIEELVKNDPENGAAHFVLANNYLERKQKDKFLEIAPSIFHFEDISVQQKLYILSQLTNYLEVDDPLIFEIIENMYATHQTDGDVALMYAETLVRKHKVNEGLELIRNSIQSKKDNYQVWLKTLVFEKEYMLYSALSEDGEEAVSLFPTMPLIYLLAAEGKLKTNELQEAKGMLEMGRLYIINDPLIEAQFESLNGELLFQEKDIKNGIIAFEKALSLDADPDIGIRYANALIRSDVALDIANELLISIPKEHKDTWYYRAKAKLEAKTKKVQQGIESLQEGIKSTSNNAELYDLLGDLYFQAEEISQAVNAWQQALDLESQNKELSRKIKDKKYYEPKYY